MTARRAGLSAVLSRLAPDIPAFEAEAVLDHAEDSPGLRHAAPEAAVWLSLLAVIRHLHTEYDDLLAEGYSVEAARWFTLQASQACLAQWGCGKRIDV